MKLQAYQDSIVVSHKKNSAWSTVHHHEEHELYYSLDGTVKFVIDNEIFQVEKGSFVFVPKGINHKTDSDISPYNERITLSFTDSIFSPDLHYIIDALATERVFNVHPEQKKNIDYLLLKLQTEYKLGSEHSAFLVQLYIQELLILLYRHRTKCQPSIPHSDKFIYEISDYILENYHQNISLQSLCKIFSLSASHLSRRFKAVTGMGVSEYITYVRLGKAEELLRTTQSSIAKIASTVGFNDSNYFSVVFKRKKGVSPYEYRKQIVR